MKTAIITGIAGQDGAFLAELLLEKGYRVIGADRRRVDTSYWRLNDLGIRDQVEMRYFDLLESSNIVELIKAIEPDEFYNLAAQSFVKASFDLPLLTADVDAMGVLRILDAIKNFSPKTKFYQASTSEMFGRVQEVPQSERTPFYPRSPYGVAKVFAHWMVVNYREAYDLFTCSGILFNHESEYRGSEFVTQKIVEQSLEILNGRRKKIVLGNLDAKRDWGYAKDYVQGMWLILQAEKPSDYVLSTGVTTTVRDFVSKVFNELDIKVSWKGEGINEKGYSQETGEVLVEVSPDFYRPTEVDLLLGDSSKAENELGWKPNTNLDELVRIMVNHKKSKME